MTERVSAIVGATFRRGGSSLGGGLDDFKLEEQELVVTDDGRYRIDITVRFTAVGVEFLILVECKDHARPVEREDVQILADKRRTAGAHKGVLFSTNGFQRGAIEYAQKHGIALVRVLEGALTYEARGAGMDGLSRRHRGRTSPPFVAQYIRESKPGTIRGQCFNRILKPTGRISDDQIANTVVSRPGRIVFRDAGTDSVHVRRGLPRSISRDIS